MAQVPQPKRGSFSFKLRAALLGLGLAAIGFTGLLSYQIAYRALEDSSYQRLTGIRETKRRQIETYFRDTDRILRMLSADESVVDALLGFQAAWLQLEAEGLAARDRQDLEAQYRTDLLPALAKAPIGPVDFASLAPRTAAGLRLQLRYWVKSQPDADDDYAAVHRLYDPGLSDFAATFGFEDLLLLDAGGVNVLYSAGKGPDLGVSTLQPAYRKSNLRAAVERAIGESGTVFEDFARYPAAEGRPTLFAAHAVKGPAGARGVLAVRLSAAKLDEVMTGGGSWRKEGLGESGETYLVGPDFLMRSDSRFQIEHPARYLDRLREAGYDEAVLSRMRLENRSILNQLVETEAARAALAGETDTRRIDDYRGVEVLSSFTPLELPDLDWVMLSEIDAEEAFQAIRSLQQRLLALALITSVAFVGVAYVLARGVTRPLIALTNEVERLGEHGRIEPHAADAFRNADDEIARLWQTFEALSERLRTTRVSRDRLDSLLASMINAVIVIGEFACDQTPVIQAANPAACKLLGYEREEIIGLPLMKILGSGDLQPPWMERLRQDRSLPAIEKEMRASDGRRIPVLFTAALVEGDFGEADQAVCVAQDIAERRLAEDRLRASRQELRVLAGRLLRAQEEERSRLARELHDDVTQRLAMLAIDAGKLAKAKGLAEEEKEQLTELKGRIAELAEDIQGLSRRLHPSALDDLGLVAALRAECVSLSKRLDIPVSFAAEGPPPSFPRESVIALYRVAQECFRNIAAHAEASEVSVELGIVNAKARLTIQDDGKGFDRDAAKQQAGLGLASMAERAHLIGGDLRVWTNPGQGVKIIMEVPLEP